MYQFARKALFHLDPEKAHHLALKSIRYSDKLTLSQHIFDSLASPVTVMGLEFRNPVGLAAGLDKDAECIDGMAALGFGFIEVGTVTPRPQAGNPKPRLFRLPEHEALINRMGFNNKGVDHLVRQVKQASYTGVLGINVGKNFDTPVDKAVYDYLTCMRKVYPYAGYIVINISSPNTPGLRELQHGKYLNELLNALKSEQEILEAKHGKRVPLVFKVAPDLDDEEIKEMALQFLSAGIEGLITTNTCASREGVEGDKYAKEAGGLSGAPIFDQSTKIQEKFYQHLGDNIPLIGVGGINSGERALERLKKGAKLLQVYTGFIYDGPGLVQNIVEKIKGDAV
ncbi:MAG: quinone-dependent dihydroorotate dehydrogenase [Pseudomonadales bacterium]|nr:quinone-dependent dihydroorotate dehydrogenase [Pseudomonadales bacterium]